MRICEEHDCEVPATKRQARVFLDKILGLELYRDETTRETVGYHIADGTNYGGTHGPLPPGARMAFLISEGARLA